MCGAFGRHLDVHNAKRIGLLPDIPVERFRLYDDAAISGCERVLVDSSGATRLESIRKKAVIVNLAQTAEFDSLFLENLYLRPQGAIET